MAARRGTSLRRRPPRRDPLPLLLVVCEGAVTEREYLDGFRLAQAANTVRVRIESPGGDPLRLVEKAVRMRDDADERADRERDDNLRFDEVWCVVDVDVHPRLPEARELAARSGIELAVSNPCFELWLLLHFTDHTSHCTCDEAARRLRGHLPSYDKHLRYEDLAAGYHEAVSRATRLGRRLARIGAPGGNPSTDVHRLTGRISALGRDARLRSR